MTWSGESGPTGSGFYIFTDDGSPEEFIGLPGEVIIWGNGVPESHPQSALTGVPPGTINDLTDVEVSAAASGQQLIFDGSLWVPDDGSIASASETYLNAYDSNGGVNVNNIATVVLDVIRSESAGAYSLNGGELTVLRDGRYKITYDCSLGVNGNNRTKATAWLELNGSEIAGTRRHQFVRQSYNCSMSATLIMHLDANDILRIRADRIGGGADLSTVADGSAITIERKSA